MPRSAPRAEAEQRLKALETRLRREGQQEARAAADSARAEAEEAQAELAARLHEEAEAEAQAAAERARRDALAFNR